MCRSLHQYQQACFSILIEPPFVFCRCVVEIVFPCRRASTDCAAAADVQLAPAASSHHFTNVEITAAPSFLTHITRIQTLVHRQLSSATMAANSARILTRPSSVTTAGFARSVPKTAARTLTTAAFSRPSLTATSQQQPASSSALPLPAFRAVARFHSSPVHSLPQIPKPGAWAKKGDINYEELKPITDSPTGVSVQ